MLRILIWDTVLFDPGYGIRNKFDPDLESAFSYNFFVLKVLNSFSIDSYFLLYLLQK
jgi:hypothetical protein